MTSDQEQHYGTLIKVSHFLDVNATDLAANPAIAAAKVIIDGLMADILAQDVVANTDNEGYTTAKTAARADLERSVVHVGSGLTGYYRVPLNAPMLGKVNQPKSFYTGASEAKLNTESELIWQIADPIKTMLAPNLVTATNVNDLNTNRLAFLALMKVPREKIGDGKAARKEMVRLFALSATELDALDDLMAVYESVNPVLFSKYQSARAIDNFGGGDGTDGFEMQTLIVPVGGTQQLINGPGPINGSRRIYIRLVQGDVVLCTTIVPPATPCLSGYNANHGHTYKDPIAGLGLDLSRPILQMSNNGSDVAIVRVGFESA